MKTIILAIAITSIMVSCGSKSSDDKNVVGIDTTAIYKNNVMADTAKAEAPLPVGAVKKVVETRAPDGTVTTTTTISNGKTGVAPRTRTNNVSSGGSGVSQTSSNTTVQKKGWSNRAKGAVIGGVGGAVVGAAVSKKKGKGAIIGGAVGAAGGYILGNEKDKKQGR